MPDNPSDRATSSPSSQHSDVLSFEMDETSMRDDVLNDSLLTSDAASTSGTDQNITPPPYVALPVTPEEADGPSVVPWTLPSAESGTARYVRKAAWLLLLLAAYASTRATVWLGIPHDGNHDLDPYDLQDDISKLLLYGFVLDWFARVTDSDRFNWLFSAPRWWFALVLLGTPVVYSLISDIPGLQHSFGDISDWGAAQWVVVVVGIGTLLLLTAYHIGLARARMTQAEVACYILSRLFASTTVLAVRQDHYKLHLHHLYLGWAFGLFAEFNTPISAATLAVTTGIFVQGIGAYSFASNLFNPNCFQLPFGSATTMDCKLAVASGNVSIEVCPLRPSVHVDAHCTVPAGR